MARDLRVKVRLTADTSSAVRNVGRASKSFSLLNKSFLAVAAGAAVVVLALRSIVRATNSIIAASSKQIDAENTLTTSLFKLGSQAVSTSAALQKQAAALELVTRFGDETILLAQAQLAAFVQDEAQLKKLTIATLDFATSQGIDVVAAAQLFGKTIGSTTNALIRYGLVVDGAVNSTERIDSLLESVGDRFGGRALTDAETFSGRIAQLGNAFGTLKERLGDSLTRNKEVTKSLREMRDVIADPKFIKGIDGLATGIASFASSSLKALKSLGNLKTGFKALREEGTATNEFFKSLEFLALPFTFLGSQIIKVTKLTEELGRIRKEEADITAETARNEQVLALRRGNLSAETQAALPFFRAFAALQERINTATKESLSREEVIAGRDTESLKALADATDAAGLSITLLSEETAKQQKAIEAAESAFARGAIGVERYEATIKAAKDRIAELNGTAEEGVASIEALGTGADRAGEQFRRFGAEADTLTGKLKRVNEESSRSFATNGPGTSGQSALFSNLASNSIGAFQTRSGTRLRVRGGSALVS